MKSHTDTLTQGEQILWEETPVPFSVVSRYNRGELILKWGIIPAIALAMIIMNTLSTGQTDIKLAILLVVISVVVAILPLTKRPKIMKQRYMVTDKRVIMFNPEFDQEYTYYINTEDIDGYRIVTGKSEKPSVVFGKSIVGDIKSNLMWRACTEIKVKEKQDNLVSCEALVFYNVNNTDLLDSILQEAGVPEM